MTARRVVVATPWSAPAKLEIFTTDESGSTIRQ